MVRYVVMKQMIVFVFKNDIAQWTERLTGKQEMRCEWSFMAMSSMSFCFHVKFLLW